MASVTIQDLEAILKLFYLGPIIESLNNQLEMVQLFTKMTLDWSGRKVVIPVHVSRNVGTGYRAEGGVLPDAGKQGHVDLNVEAKYLYGRFSLTGPSIATAKTTANSFATYVQTEMDGLVTDTKLKANQAMFTGGGCVGFIHATTAVAIGQTNVYSFTGNKSVLSTLQGIAVDPTTTPPGVPGNQLQLDVISMATYESLHHTNVFPRVDPGFIVCDGNAAAAATDNLIEIKTDNLGQIQLGLLAGTRNPAMIKVVASGSAAAMPGAPFVPLAAALDPVKIAVDNEAFGIYANLGNTTHFTVDRSIDGTGANVNPSLRSTVEAIQTAAFVGPANPPNFPLDFNRIQTILDEIMVLGGDDPDCIYIHPGLRQRYSNLLTFTAPGQMTKDAQGKPGTGDPGFSGYAFNSIPLKMSRHCGKGMMVFLKTKNWSVAELKSFGMADLDGNVLSRLANKDEWEGFVSWYYNLVCKEPNRQAMLTGIDFP